MSNITAIGILIVIVAIYNTAFATWYYTRSDKMSQQERQLALIAFAMSVVMSIYTIWNS